METLQVQKLTENAVLPKKGSQHSAGYDLSAAYDGIIPARGKALIKTGKPGCTTYTIECPYWNTFIDLAIACPEGTYGRIAPRSGLAWKHSIDVGAGVSSYNRYYISRPLTGPFIVSKD